MSNPEPEDSLEGLDRHTLERFLGEGEADKVTTPEEMSRTIALRYLEAQTVEEVLSPVEPIKGEDLYGVTITVESVDFARSGLEGAMGVYAMCKGTRHDIDQDVMFSVGGSNVLAQLLRLKELDALPIKVRIVQSNKATARGYYPLRLEPADL